MKTIDCNIPDQLVTITYDSEKTKPEALIKAVEKCGYTATQVTTDGKKQDAKGTKKSGK